MQMKVDDFEAQFWYLRVRYPSAKEPVGVYDIQWLFHEKK